MTTGEKRRAYQAFFQKSEAGVEFLTKLEEMIKENHRLAENQADLSRDYTQRSKGIRDVMAHISSLTAERGLLSK